MGRGRSRKRRPVRIGPLTSVVEPDDVNNGQGSIATTTETKRSDFSHQLLHCLSCEDVGHQDRFLASTGDKMQPVPPHLRV